MPTCLATSDGKPANQPAHQQTPGESLCPAADAT
eukprot:CAMPEP_0183443468 /NCGR_PEP_ID=MMETSP0370-20130417/91912_1 /TAXON_ID=268820 /ORGANISM="Peridinium aciculiferum, Strain PAER-2" /LENGTH=33 /DNA_ID= /DNA_START= /DNA_END= /DNA_ORIENTATION=